MTAEENTATKLWSKVIKRKFPNCLFCGNTSYSRRLDAAHILPKSRSKSIRWDLENGMTLCLVCHQMYDEDWTDIIRHNFINRIFGEDRWESLQVKSRVIFTAPMEYILTYLKAEK